MFLLPSNIGGDVGFSRVYDVNASSGSFYNHNNKGHYHLGSKNLDHACDSGLLEGLGLDKNKEMNNCIVGRKPLFTMHKTK